MRVIRHQTIGPDAHAFFAAPLCHQIDVDGVVIGAKKCLLPAIAPLGNVMGHSRDDDTSKSGHASVVPTRGRHVKN